MCPPGERAGSGPDRREGRGGPSGRLQIRPSRLCGSSISVHAAPMRIVVLRRWSPSSELVPMRGGHDCGCPPRCRRGSFYPHCAAARSGSRSSRYLSRNPGNAISAIPNHFPRLLGLSGKKNFRGHSDGAVVFPYAGNRDIAELDLVHETSLVDPRFNGTVRGVRAWRYQSRDCSRTRTGQGRFRRLYSGGDKASRRLPWKDQQFLESPWTITR